jgi:N-acetyl sugar amidotransferase
MTKYMAKYGLPPDVKFCKKCVMSNQMPSAVVELEHGKDDKKPTLDFDEYGVCHACRYSEVKGDIDWREREEQLKELLAKHRRNDGSYDVLVPSSGGKDSTYVAHLLKYKYGMNPLTVTWAPHIYTDIGWKNFQNLIQQGFDNILCTPNGKVHRKLSQLAFKSLFFLFQPFVFGQKNVAPRISLEKKIPLVFYGESPSEYNSNIKGSESPLMPHEHYSRPREQLNESRLAGYTVQELAEMGIDKGDLNLYLPLCIDDLERNGTEVHFMGYYNKWDPQSIYYYAVENVGFEANPERTEGTYSKYSSLDDKLDGLHYFTTYIKFGIGRASYDAAQEIRNGHITRDEGVALVRKYDGEFPEKYFKEFQNYVDLSEEEFWDIVDNARSEHLWNKENGNWKLRHIVE